MTNAYEQISWFFDRWKAWAAPVLVYQVMVIILRLAGKIGWPWWVVSLPIEIIGVLLAFGLAITYLILRKHH